MQPVQIAGTPLAIGKEEDKQEEEKEETQDEEQSAIQTLIDLPKIGTPTKTLQQPSSDMVTLQITTPSLSSTRIARTIHYGIPELDEEIKIPSSTLTEEKMNEIQSALDRRRIQEAMRKEYKYNQTMSEIKDIFMDGFTL